MLKRTDIINSKELEKILTIQNSLDLNLRHWEGKHREYSHTSEIGFGEDNYSLTINVYAEQQHPENNKGNCS